MTLEKTHTEMGRNAKLYNIYISSDWTNLDPGFRRRISSKLFKAPPPLSTGVLACGLYKAFILRVKVSGRGQSSVVLEAINREEEVI